MTIPPMTPTAPRPFALGETVQAELAGGPCTATILGEVTSITHRLAEMGRCYLLTVTASANPAVAVGDTLSTRAIWLTPAAASTHG